MTNLKPLTLAFAVLTLAGSAIAPAIAGDNAMMKKSEHMQMERISQERPYSEAAFSEAQAGGKPFLVAFHKKGCPMCAKQKQALSKIYQDDKNITVLVVDYLNDTKALQKFNVGMQGELLGYKGDKEINRSSALTDAGAITKQIDAVAMAGNGAMMMKKDAMNK